MKREFHVRFCERPRGRFLWPTRPHYREFHGAGPDETKAKDGLRLYGLKRDTGQAPVKQKKIRVALGKQDKQDIFSLPGQQAKSASATRKKIHITPATK